MADEFEKRVKEPWIFLDVDNVLLRYSDDFMRYMAAAHPSVKVKRGDYFPNKYVNEFQDSSAFERLRPVKGAFEGVMKLQASGVRVTLLTKAIKNELQSYRRTKNLINLFGGEELIRGAMYERKPEWKIDLVKQWWFGSKPLWLLIDDNPFECYWWAKRGMPALMHDGNFWDQIKYPPTHFNVVKCENWGQISHAADLYIQHHPGKKDI